MGSGFNSFAAFSPTCETQFKCRFVATSHVVSNATAVIAVGRVDELDHLRRQLNLDKSTSLSTVVSEAYCKWGARDFADYLFGDFALVLWDRTAKRLILSRSPSGFYPLCYTHEASRVSFATCPKQLLREASIPFALDEQAIAEWLVLRPRLSDRTLFSRVHWVQPGSSVVFERGRLEQVRNWRPERLPELQLQDHHEYADALRESLQMAVRDRLQSTNGPIASQLSGGLDSSSVTAFAAEHLALTGAKLFAYTAVPGTIAQSPVEGRFFDESSHAAAVASEHSNIVHTCVNTSGTSLFEVLDRYTDIEAGPPFNPHHLQWIDRTYAASSAAGATTLLTGSMGNMTVSASGSLAAIDALQNGRLMQAARLFAADCQSGTRGLRNIPGTLAAAWMPSLLDVADRLRRTHSNLEEFTGLRPEFARTNGLDFQNWNRRLPFQSVREQTLDGVNRFDFGMFHEAPRRLYGLNATDPTFDRRVVELALRIPLEQFCAGGVPRALIRTAMDGRLPNIVRLERRRGLQSADFLSMLDRERTEVSKELNRMRAVDLLSRAIDVPLLQERLDWTSQQVIDYGWHQYSNRLMRALSMGRFVRRAMDGSLFSTAQTHHHIDESFILVL